MPRVWLPRGETLGELAAGLGGGGRLGPVGEEVHRLELRLEREDLVHGSRRRRRVSIGCVEPAGESTLGRATAARPAGSKKVQ